jgi:hypothetical protein
MSFSMGSKLNVLRDSGSSQVWWCMPIIPALRRLQWEGHEFEVSLVTGGETGEYTIDFKERLLFCSSVC